MGFLIKIASYNPLTAIRGSVFALRCSVILKKPGKSNIERRQETSHRSK